MGMPTFVTSDMSRSDAITDIIQSVALQQAALSHILNAEGEKIQHVLGDKCTTTDEILEVNKSVRKMVDSISKLEILLQHKLSLFEDALCFPMDEFNSRRGHEHSKCDTPCDYNGCVKSHEHSCTCKHDTHGYNRSKHPHPSEGSKFYKQEMYSDEEIEEIIAEEFLEYDTIKKHLHEDCQCEICRGKSS